MAAFGLVAACARGGGTSGGGASLLSLSWSPQYCASHLDDREQCAGAPHGFVVHGLWPLDHEDRTRCPGARVEEDTIRRMLPLMPSHGLVIHEWLAHGRCSGLSPEDYFARVSKAAQRVRIPPELSAVQQDRSFDGDRIVGRFTAANPGLSAQGIELVCEGGDLREVRICLDPALDFGTCPAAGARGCAGSIRLRAMR